MTVELKVGDKAPDFKLTADGDSSVSLKQFKGKKVVLYFYPKDDTPGCTKEAISFTEHLNAFENANTVIIGASKDTVAKHEKFKAKHALNITLVSDEDGTLCENYGVWVLKKNYGREYMGIDRSTFLIDEKGKIAQVWRKVRVNGHVEKVLEAAESI